MRDKMEKMDIKIIGEILINQFENFSVTSQICQRFNIHYSYAITFDNIIRKDLYIKFIRGQSPNTASHFL